MDGEREEDSGVAAAAFSQNGLSGLGGGGQAPLPDPRRWLLRGAPWRSRRCHFSWVYSRQLSEGDGAGEILLFCGRATRSRDPAVLRIWGRGFSSLASGVRIFSGFSLLGSLETFFASLRPFNSVGWGLGVGAGGGGSGCCKSDAGNSWAFRLHRICKTSF